MLNVTAQGKHLRVLFALLFVKYLQLKKSKFTINKYTEIKLVKKYFQQIIMQSVVQKLSIDLRNQLQGQQI